MNELRLRYGMNPEQTEARVYTQGKEMPLKVLNGAPGYINLLDALNGWQLVKELRAVTGMAAAASFKHVSPAGVGTSVPLTDTLKKAYHLEGYALSDMAVAYARARGADRMSSYGDFVALSGECDKETATLMKREVSDGVIAPSYSEEALHILKEKKKGAYLILQSDETYVPEEVERRDVFGLTFEQRRGRSHIDPEIWENIVTNKKELPEGAMRDLLIALVTVKYTQSNSVCYAYDGQSIGIGAGQQSRVHCVRLAGDKADLWQLRQHPAILNLQFCKGVKLVDKDNAIDALLSDPESILSDEAGRRVFEVKPELLEEKQRKEWLEKVTGVSLGSDAFFPFGDNIERARRSGVSYVAQTGGSIRDDHVIETCNKYGMIMVMTGIRLFHH